MIHSLQHFALGVPDLKAGSEFYGTFGLNQRDVSGKELRFSCDGRNHDEVVLFETGKQRKFHHISFGADQAGFDAIANTLEARGIERLRKPSPDAPDGLWFHDVDGNLVNVHVAVKPSQAPEAAPQINRPGSISRAGQRGCPGRNTVSRPRRLGHIIMFTPNVPRMMKFYTETLGMKVSDTIVEEFGAFMRVAGDSDHHVLGLLKSDAPGFHHASFEMNSLDETALAALRLKGAGYKHAWGPGRHAIGSNYFHYFRDPWNGMAEYFYDMDYIPQSSDWQAGAWTKPEGMFLWSADGPPPPDFGRNYELD